MRLKFKLLIKFSLALVFVAAGFNYSRAETDYSYNFSLASLFSAPPVAQEGDLNIYFISVGQGDAIYIELPNGSNALIDGGPNAADIGGFLTSRGVTAINHVVLTHPHSDHFMGLKQVFKMARVKNFYDTKCTPNDAIEMISSLRQQAAESGSKVYFPAEGGKFNWSPRVSIRILNGAPTSKIAAANANNMNNCSIVMQLTYQDVSVMLTGDADSPISDKMAQTYGPSLRSLVLKVPHHGDANAMTPDFINSVKPKIAIIEVGPNRFGHPTPEALAILKSVGAKVLRTDAQGTMLLTIRNGAVLPVKSVAPPSGFIATHK